ncbi:hypothetical protein SAMN04515679_4482 [Pelosinus fermentans]|uniref:hypothetical protein n=1 Tax=Pelosinus fermentans TaxID=365349 RepID=UPI0002684F84|nr:hypothetical protein [Pelosinus fermentans]OAM96287.1 hypothetical protein FR7_04309 [Pelosinus fermentans DSM 17108]SDR38467.1 hypothetical protein SAMN04515679_4482 [Pelosinus fermentans]
MPRTARKKSKSGIYHIIMLRINWQTILEDEEDRAQFLEALQRYNFYFSSDQQRTSSLLLKKRRVAKQFFNKRFAIRPFFIV